MILQRIAKMSSIATLVVFSACAGLGSQARPATTERLDGRGVSTPTLSTVGGDQVRFVNDDARPHQIYSNDCPELSSALLQPGEAFVATVGNGDKICHFQDLIAPAASAYEGTVQVEMAASPEGP